MRKLLVASHKGGVGKTTTCINLATAATQAGSRVLLLDADPLAAIGASLNLAGHPQRKPLRQAGIDLPGVLVTGIIPGLDLISPYEDGSCSDKELNELLTLLATSSFADCYSTMIVDTPPFMGANPAELLNVCDEFIVVMRAEPLAYRTLPAFLELVQRSKKPERTLPMLGILLTLSEGEPLGGRWECELRGRFGQRILPQVVPFDDEVGKALMMGQIVSLYNPESSASQQYLALTETLSLTQAQDQVHALSSESPLLTLAASYRESLASVQGNSNGNHTFHSGGSATAVAPPPEQEEAEEGAAYPAPESPSGLNQLGISFPEEPELPREKKLPDQKVLSSADFISLPEPDAEPKPKPKPVVVAPRPAPAHRPPAVQPSPPARPAAVPRPPVKSARRARTPTPVGGPSTNYPWVLWVALAIVGGVGLRFVKLPGFMVPFVVGLAVAGITILVLRLLANPPDPSAPQPQRRPAQTGRPGKRPTPSVPAHAPTSRAEAAKKDAGARLANLANRATAGRRNPHSHN